jgi:hypothetical protein
MKKGGFLFEATVINHQLEQCFVSQNISKTAIFTKKDVSDTDYGLKKKTFIFIVLVKNICT